MPVSYGCKDTGTEDRDGAVSKRRGGFFPCGIAGLKSGADAAVRRCIGSES